MQVVSLKQFKADMKAMGYKTRTISNSDFKYISVRSDDIKLNAGNVFSQEFLDEHRPFFNYKNNHKIEVTDGWRYLF